MKVYSGGRKGGALLTENSPDESQTSINVRVFPALLQDRREVLTATSTSGNPNAWSRVAAAEGKIAMAISFQDAGKFRLKHAEETFSVIRGRARPSSSYNR